MIEIKFLNEWINNEEHELLIGKKLNEITQLTSGDTLIIALDRMNVHTVDPPRCIGVTLCGYRGYQKMLIMEHFPNGDFNDFALNFTG